MHPFEYLKPVELDSAVRSGASHRSDLRRGAGVDFIAGGTDVLPLLGAGVRAPSQLIDITALPGLAEIMVDEAGIRLGALVRLSDAAVDPVLRMRCPVVVEALLASASPQVRNLATLGGNLLQRTRCSYFREPGTLCAKRVPGSGCSAEAGIHRNHAIFGISEACFATYAGDLAVALLALDADLLILGPDGERRLPLGQLHCLPGEAPWVESRLAPGELITTILIPDSAAAQCSHYLKVRDRASFEWAISSHIVANLTEAVRCL